MEINEYAERLLLGNRLEDKLFFPSEKLTDKAALPFTTKVSAPGRPEALKFADHTVPIPKLHELENEKQRGYMLHFFANHELLAIELMALALLRFPDAPKAFRRGIIHTIQEEQGHVNLYIDRMKECGVALGDIPLNDFFWKVMKDMKTPMDYVIQMSLTLEQANLDFSKFYMQAFDAIGDHQTAKALKQVYEEEIGHVNYGLQWFRRWKDPKKTDWQVFLDSLVLPLSPARAKGQVFDYQGRVESGLDEEFIRQMEVYSQSKGRPPSVFVFHPTCERYWSEGLGFNPKRQQRQLNEELESLMMFFAASDDLVLLKRKPSVEHLRYLQDLGFKVPQFVETEKNVLTLKDIEHRHLTAIRPWGWSPFAERQFGKFKKHCSPVAKELFSKVKGAELLKKFTEKYPCASYSPADDQAVICRSQDEVQVAMAKSYSDSFVIKAPLGASGQNMIRVFEGTWEAWQEKWLKNTLTQQAEVLVEPLLDSVAEFSFHFDFNKEGLHDRGLTRLISDQRGQYSASLVGDSLHDLSTDVKRFLHRDGKRLLLDTAADLRNFLFKELENQAFDGPIGVDAMLYRRGEEYFFKPIQELNPRYTMGRLAIQLNRQRAMSGIPSLLVMDRDEKMTLEVGVEKDKQERVKSGVIRLNDPEQSPNYRMFLVVGREKIAEALM